MPSAFTHAAAAAAIGTLVVPGRGRLIALGALCSVLPDADVIGFRVGIPYEHMLGHRGLSHGLLDAITNGGLGVAFFAPLSGRRYFFPWRPIVVSPISVRRFMTARGIAVVMSELLIVWIPAMAVSVAGMAARRWRARVGRPG